MLAHDTIRIVLVTACLFISTMSMNIMFALNSNLPLPLEEMFNQSFFNHYGSYLTDFGIATIWSADHYGISLAQLLSVFLVYPLLDTKGPKFIYVQLRTVFIFAFCAMQTLAYFIPSFEVFLLGNWICGLIRLSSFLAASFYQNEITPPEYRGVIVGISALVETIEAIITMNLTRPSVFGSSESWIYLPLLALLFTLLPSIYLLYLPDPFKKERRRFSTYGSINDYEFDGVLKKKEIEIEPPKVSNKMEVIRDHSLRKTLLLLLILQIFIDISPKTVESTFYTRLHELMGFNQDTIMTIGTIQKVVFIPIYFASTMAIKKYGTRFAALSAIFVLYLKNLITLSALLFAYLNGPSAVSQILGILGDILTGVHGCFGYVSLFYLILFETAPLHARTSIAQIVNLISMAMTAVFIAIVPYTFNFFSPLPFLLIFLIYPFLIRYVYRNLPGREASSSRSEEDEQKLIQK